MPKKIPAITEVQVKTAKPQDKAFKLAETCGQGRQTRLME